MTSAQTAREYDLQWQRLDDFIRYNPGARHRRRQILSLLDGLSFESLLDVGCGPGELLMTVARAFSSGKRFTGCDFAPEVIENNRSRLPGIAFARYDLQAGAGELPESQYDIVVCSEVLEHLEDQQAAFGHLAGLVKPGGWLILSCPTGKRFATEVHFGHVHHPTAREVRRYAAENGLEVQVLKNWGWPVYRGLKEAVNLNADWSLRNFGSGGYSPSKKILNHLLFAANFLNAPSFPWGCQLFGRFYKPMGH